MVSFSKWTEDYLANLKRVSRQSTTEERYEFLDHYHGLFETALSKVGTCLKSEVFGLLPATKRIDRGVLRPDNEPFASMREKQATHDRLVQLRTEFPSFLLKSPESSSAVGLFKVIFSSFNPAHRSSVNPIVKAWRKRSHSI